VVLDYFIHFKLLIMGTRLYASKKEGISTLALYNASFNESMTQERYEYYLSKKAELEGSDDAWYEFFYADKSNADLNQLNAFEVFGYGKYRYPLSSHLESDGYLTPCGDESDSKKIEHMCVLNDIEYDDIKDLIEYIYWC
jgi:hypothetical protein